MRFIFALIPLICTIACRAQVYNDDIHFATTLKVDSLPVHSSTAKASVQWPCVNKALTNSCLVYHNDQWFTFVVDSAGSYYLNFSAQDCQHVNHGLQLLLIEGVPCQSKSYRIRKCISKIPQNDTFVLLDSIKAGVHYLLNVDGFLNDQCSFSLQLATKPIGFDPTPVALDSSIVLKQNERVVSLHWKVSPSILSSITNMQVWRRERRGRGKLRGTLTPMRNTYGTFTENYSFVDTVKEDGEYVYAVWVQPTSNMPMKLVEEKEIKINLLIEAAEGTLSIRYSEGTPLEIMIYDPILGVILDQWQFNVNESMRKHGLVIPLDPYVSLDNRRIDIVEINKRTKERIVHHYQLGKYGGATLIR